MKTTEQIITTLEQDFFLHHVKMDEAMSMLKEARKEHNGLKSDIYEHKVGEESTLCCYICDILADINNTSEDYEMDRLYTKFNLWRYNE